MTKHFLYYQNQENNVPVTIEAHWRAVRNIVSPEPYDNKVIHNIGVIAGGHVGDDPEDAMVAQHVGRLLADHGRTLMYWGATKGLLKETRRAWEDRVGFCRANPYHHVDSDPEIIIQKKKILINGSQGFLILPGGIGMLDEMTDALTEQYVESYKPETEQNRKPIVILNRNGFFDGFFRCLDKCIEEGFARPEVKSLYTEVKAPHEAMQSFKDFEELEHKAIAPIGNVEALELDLRVTDQDTDFGAEGAEKIKALTQPGEKKGIRRVCVFTGSSYGVDPAYRADAKYLGEYLEITGRELVYGGGTRGNMGAVYEGFTDGLSLEEVRKRVHAVSLRVFEEAGDYAGRRNEILCDTIYERKQIMADRSDAIIALPGGLGTLDEIMDGIRYNHRLLRTGRHSDMIPIVLVNQNEFYEPFIAWVLEMAETGLVEPDILDTFVIAKDAQHSMELIEEFEARLTEPTNQPSFPAGPQQVRPEPL